MSNNISNLIILIAMVILASFCAGFLIMSASQLESLHENIISERDNSTLCDSYANADNITYNYVIVDNPKGLNPNMTTYRPFISWEEYSNVSIDELYENCIKND